MKKDKLSVAVQNTKNKTAQAISAILGAITNQGQRKKVLKNEKVRELCERYGIDIDD